jgi:hypothetical protein
MDISSRPIYPGGVVTEGSGLEGGHHFRHSLIRLGLHGILPNCQGIQRNLNKTEGGLGKPFPAGGVSADCRPDLLFFTSYALKLICNHM